jgi:hypothetical protein
MRASPVLGVLALFSLMCVGLIAGLTSIGSGASQTATAFGVASTTMIIWDPSRQTGQDGGERTGEFRYSTTTATDDAGVPDIEPPPIIVTNGGSDTGTNTAPTTTQDVVVIGGVVVTQNPPPTIPQITTPVQPNDSAIRVMVTTTPATQSAVDISNQSQTTPPPVTTAGSEEAEESRARISDIGESLRQFQREVRRVENTVRERVTREVEQVFERADLRSAEREEPVVRAFDPEERRKRLDALTSRLSQDVRPVIASSENTEGTANLLQPVLKSSLDEIRLLIRADTGVDVDLSPSARAVAEVVAENTELVTKVREELLERDGLELYADNDNDGISNFDEKNIYKTDPNNAYTAGGTLTDGESVLLGFDVLSKEIKQVPVESPQVAGAVVENVFEVHAINVNLKPIVSEPVSEEPEKPVMGEVGEVIPASVPVFEESITFAGRALPNSFVTLYVFSTPVVVTVKADVSGAWTYTLDTELEDGNHELYVATVDAGGRILAKSPAVPFVKRAEAAEFTPLLIPETPEVTPLSLLQNNLTLVGVVAFVVFALIALIILGVLRSGPKEPTLAA